MNNLRPEVKQAQDDTQELASWLVDGEIDGKDFADTFRTIMAEWSNPSHSVAYMLLEKCTLEDAEAIITSVADPLIKGVAKRRRDILEIVEAL